jgi:Polyketide cyclase / dehydrase and lipid transport
MSTKSPVNVTVTKVIAAEADSIYDLVADITRMPHYSPENTAGEWLDGATSPAVGARFKGSNRLGKATWSTKPTVTVADRGREFAFKVPGAAGARWSYRFEPTTGGTLVTESVGQTKRSPLPIRMIQRLNGVTDRNADLRAGMATTLDRLAAEIAADHLTRA